MISIATILRVIAYAGAAGTCGAYGMRFNSPGFWIVMGCMMVIDASSYVDAVAKDKI